MQEILIVCQAEHVLVEVLIYQQSGYLATKSSLTLKGMVCAPVSSSPWVLLGTELQAKWRLIFTNTQSNTSSLGVDSGWMAVTSIQQDSFKLLSQVHYVWVSAPWTRGSLFAVLVSAPGIGCSCVCLLDLELPDFLLGFWNNKAYSVAQWWGLWQWKLAIRSLQRTPHPQL